MNKFYITTAIDYVNAKPHLGHALEKIQADVLARWYRQKLGDENVHFLTGVDEHGQKVFRTAEKEGKPVEEFVEENTAKFLKMKDDFNLSFDDFIRTTDQKRHWPAVQKLWKKLDEAGALEKRQYAGLYCTGCESFKTKKEIDQSGHCLIHANLKAERVEEENYFFKLSEYQEFLIKHYEDNPGFVWPKNRYTEMLNFIKNGLADVSFSRPVSSLSWGVPVPGDPDHVMYVWCDALTNYISAVGYADESEEFKKWWPADIHLVGLDIQRFHAVIWPVMLHVAGIELPKQIMVHGFITSEGGKMSKSVGNVVDPVTIAEEYGADALRYYLLREIPSGKDGDFSMERFHARYESDLANGLGNLVQRVAILIQRNCEGEVDAVEPTIDPQKLGLALEEKAFDQYLEHVFKEVNRLNVAIEENKPWQLVNTDPEKLKAFLSQQAADIAAIGKALAPCLPETAEKIAAVFSSGKIAAPQETLFPRKDLKK